MYDKNKKNFYSSMYQSKRKSHHYNLMPFFGDVDEKLCTPFCEMRTCYENLLGKFEHYIVIEVTLED